ncbi:MAG: TetR/AcrR family transcriptional regulator [Lachnospiraceae bacterium]|nr:TetR/AcrR family transcriptional regulator [Lachnospiraceae bacterium]
MKDEKETRNKLLESAKAEFMEKGYTGASLRNICKNAGVTTGALYFFFQDKEDLFASLVADPLQELITLMSEHYQSEVDTEKIEDFYKNRDFSEDLQISNKVIAYMYQNYDAFLLLLNRAQGSKYENVVDEFVAVSEKHYHMMADRWCETFGKPAVEDYMIHWIAHMQIDAFAHLLLHEPNKEKAQRHIVKIVRYLIVGWIDMIFNN